MSQEVKEKGKRFFPWVLLFLTMLLIFLLSSQSTVETQQLSRSVSEKLLEIQQLLFGNSANLINNAEEINWKLRKLAHFVLFLLLGILASFVFAGRQPTSRKWILPAILICILYAVGDEFHQMFVLGRTASVQDVLLDSAGSITGIAWYHWRRGRRDDGKI